MIRLIFVLSLVLAGEVFASTANIQTVVNTETGEMLYACNARIRHQGMGDTECVNLSNGESCSPEKAAENGTACVCRSKMNWGDQIIGLTSSERTQIALAGAEWGYLVSPEKSFVNKLLDVDVSLGSETLGAEYAVTFCYVGPKETLKKKTHPEEQDQDLSEGRYQLDVSLAGINYGRSLAQARFAYVCDLRQSGMHGSPRGPNDLAPAGGMPEHDDSYETQFLGGDSGHSEIRFAKESLILNQDSAQVPRFCVFEFRFKELDRGVRDAVNKGANFSGKIRICKSGGDCP